MPFLRVTVNSYKIRANMIHVKSIESLVIYVSLFGSFIMNTKVKKPFYKRVWFWAIAVVIVIPMIAGAGNSGAEDHTKTATSTKSKSTSSSSTPTTQKWTQADYDALTVGDIMNNAEGGENMDDVTAKFGKPTSTNDMSIGDTSSRTATWMHLTSDVILTFDKQEDGSWLLSSKNSSGLK